ncbi:hypothetical protein [Trichothermofontia sp.]
MFQSLTDESKARKIVIFGSLVIGILFVLHVLKYDFIADDAFITLRYARNLSRGEELVFNSGERVEGFSSLLWTLITAVPPVLGLNQVVSARFLGLMSGLLTLALAYKLFLSVSQTKYSRLFGLLIPIIIATNGSFVAWAASGMETPLYSCLIVGAILAIIQDNLIWSVVLMIACILVRPEGILIFLSGSLFKIYKFSKAEQLSNNIHIIRNLLTWFMSGLGILVALTLFRYFYFGDFLPNTFYAKSNAGFDQLLQGFRYFINYASDHEGLLVIVASTLFFLLFGTSKECFIAFNVLLFWSATIWVGGDGLPMYRFALAALPLISVLEVLLFERIYIFSVEKIAARRLVDSFFIALFFVWIFLNVSNPDILPYYLRYQYHQNEVPQWTLVGQWFAKYAKKEESIACVPIGAISYYSDLKVYDMLGLTDKHIAHRKMPETGKFARIVGHSKYDGQYILSRKPTYLLLGNVDVTSQPRDPYSIPFIPYSAPVIYEREKDIYDTNILIERYIPRSVLIALNQYLNFYELKPEWRE